MHNILVESMLYTAITLFAWQNALRVYQSRILENCSFFLAQSNVELVLVLVHADIIFLM